jgi:trehalose synthase
VAQVNSVTTVELEDAAIARFRPLLDDDVRAQLDDTMARLGKAARGRVIWNINSTARGGGVAEMLRALIPYSRGSGIDERWLVIDGTPRFFDVTKKLHMLLHGVRNDGKVGEGLDERDRREYEAATERNAAALAGLVRPRDVVILQDPQTAGLAPPLRALGARVVWRSHIGVDQANDVVREAWAFLLPYVRGADAVVFSRRAYTWEGLEGTRVAIIPPCIDPFAPKNTDVSDREMDAILEAASLPHRPRTVLQVSRWDRLKDPAGVVDAFAEHIAPRTDASLMLAGPAVTSVADDPEQPEVLGEVVERVRALPEPLRKRIAIAQLPMADIEKNAMMVNALQRRAEVVVQKSLAEGFGLTVAEAMWKRRPVVASRIGGIGDQIEHGRSGLLVDDPRDLRGFGDAVINLLADPGKAAELGAEGRRRVARDFITPRHLVAQGRLILDLIGN